MYDQLQEQFLSVEYAQTMLMSAAKNAELQARTFIAEWARVAVANVDNQGSSSIAKIKAYRLLTAYNADGCDANVPGLLPILDEALRVAESKFNPSSPRDLYVELWRDEVLLVKQRSSI